MALRSLASASIVRPRASASRRASRATRSRLTRPRARGGGSHERWSFERHGPYYSGDSVDYSFDGDESYPLDPEPRAMPWDDFPPRPTTPPPGRPRRERGPAWTRDDDDDDDRVGSSDAGAPARGGEAAAWTRTSAHAAIPHVVSVKLPRPAARHVEVAPRRGSAARQYDAFGAEVPVQVRRPPRPRAKKSNDARVSKKTPRPRRPTSPSPNLPPTPPPPFPVAQVSDSFDDEPTGAVVVDVARHPGLAHGLVQPGDVLVALCDEWKTPTDLLVDEQPFGRIKRALEEPGERPLTLRFERFPRDDPAGGEFVAAHVGDRTSVRHSRQR